MAKTGNHRSGGGTRSGAGPRRIEAGQADAAVPKDAEQADVGTYNKRQPVYSPLLAREDGSRTISEGLVKAADAEAATLGRPRAPTEAEAADRGASAAPVSTDDLVEAQKFALEQLYGKRKAQSIFKRLTAPDVAVRDDAASLLDRALEWDAFTKSAAYSGMDKAARKEARTAHATMPAEELAAKYGVADSGDGNSGDMFDAAASAKRSQLINTIAGLDADVRRKLDTLTSDKDGGDSVKHEPLRADFDAIGESPDNASLDDLEGELAALQQFAGKVNAAYDEQFPRAVATATPQPQANVAEFGPNVANVASGFDAASTAPQPTPADPADAGTAPQPTTVDMVERAKYEKAVKALKRLKRQAANEAAANAAAQASIARLNALLSAAPAPPNTPNAGGTNAATGAQTPTPATPTMVQRTKNVMSSLVPSWAGPVYRGTAAVVKSPPAIMAGGALAKTTGFFRDLGTGALATDAVVATPINLMMGNGAFPITRGFAKGVYGAFGGYDNNEEEADNSGIDWFMYENQPAMQPKQVAPQPQQPSPMAMPAAVVPRQGGFSAMDAINEYNDALMPQPPLRVDAPVGQRVFR